MTQDYILAILLRNFPHEPTPDQQILLQRLAGYLGDSDPNVVFLIKGYAGTGKSTAVGAVVQSLARIGWSPVLLAPTGRAAKVLANYAKRPAYTIHKMIYQFRQVPGGGSSFALKANRSQKTMYLVDEASMISGTSRGTLNLLDDLVEYVASGHRCKLVLIGDTAQLPPVGASLSPALDPEYLNQRYFYRVMGAELKNVMRQQETSGILWNATAVREKIRLEAITYPKFQIEGFPDIFRINGEQLEDALNEAYDHYSTEDTVVICRSNKRANLFNQQIRARIRWQEDELSAGDYLMTVKNNYHWLEPKSKAGFIANGDIMEVQRLGHRQEIHGFRFAEATLRMVDYPDEPDIEANLLLDTLNIETPALAHADQDRLYRSVLEDYADLPTRGQRIAKLKSDPFFNALQVKFAYAVTCHKAQGGQWKAVFVDQGYLTKEMLDTDYLRWLYTAISRASERLYLVNFAPDFFSRSETQDDW